MSITVGGVALGTWAPGHLQLAILGEGGFATTLTDSSSGSGPIRARSPAGYWLDPPQWPVLTPPKKNPLVIAHSRFSSRWFPVRGRNSGLLHQKLGFLAPEALIYWHQEPGFLARISISGSGTPRFWHRKLAFLALEAWVPGTGNPYFWHWMFGLLGLGD